MANLQSLADDVATRLTSIADRASNVTRGIGLLTTASVGLAYVVGLLVFPSPWRWVWAVVGLVLGAIPVVAISTAHRRLRRIPKTFTETVADVQTLMADAGVRSALYDLVERDPEKDRTSSLIELGKELNTLRVALAPKRETLTNLWANITAITTLPGLMALGVVGSFVALIFSVATVILGLAL
jgi:ABC-type multidrug transport system fused ATPase/permease subunit